jgi:hypothetical protein
MELWYIQQMSKTELKTSITAGVCDFLRKSTAPLLVTNSKGIQVTLTVSDIGYEAMYSSIWMSPTSYGGVRLTEFGDMMLRAMNAAHHDFVLPFPAGQFIHLIARTSKLVTLPYYLSTKSNAMIFRIYDDEIATMIGLYGTLNEYLDSLENNNWKT